MLFQDLRYALRGIRKNPSFAVVVILSLGLGIGANSAIFSVINAVMLRSLPVERPAELFAIRPDAKPAVGQRFSYPMFQRLHASLLPKAEMAAVSRVARMYAVLETGSQPETTSIQLVSGEFFPLVGSSAILGRTLTPDDNRNLGGHPLAVLSEGYWRRRFAASRDVLGRDFTLNGSRFTIIGVGPAGLAGVWLESPVDVWIPTMMQADARYAQNYSASNAQDQKPWTPQEGIRWLDLIVRTKDDSSVLAALNVTYQQELQRAAARIADPERRRLFLQQSLRFEAFGHGFSNLRQRFEIPLYTLMAMVALVLLIACANTANLLLARAASRQREIAVRLSMGASRRRLIQQVLTESLLLVGIASCAGLLLAHWASSLLVQMTVGATASPFSAGVDLRVLGFTIVLAVCTCLLFGLAPALRATHVDLSGALKQAARGISGGSRFSAAKMLVAGQVALSLILLMGAGLFMRSLQNLMQVELGFEREHLLSVRINPQPAGIPATRLPGLYRSLIERLESIPGVRSATVSMCGLADGCNSSSDGLQITGYQNRPDEQVLLRFNRVGANYVETVGMRLVAGRDFDARDTETSPAVALINEAMVRRYFGKRNPVGERFGSPPTISIVGVVRDARVSVVQEAAVPMVWYPMQQGIVPAGSLEIRVIGDPRAVANDARKAVADVDALLPVVRVRTMNEQVEANLNQERLIARLTGIFGGLALLLASIGLYGVMSHAVSRRTAELGIRMALGAAPMRVLGMVFGESLALVVIGLAVGAPLVLAAGRPLSRILFEVQPSDPYLLSGAALALLVVAAIAGFIPARRASRVDPLVALRNE